MDKELKLILDDLTERLKRLESMCFSENILYIKTDENRENIFKHILYIYFYCNRTLNYHHWCSEITNFINIILASKKKKGGKNPNRNEALNEILSNRYYLEDGFNDLMEKIISKEGNIDKNRYKNKHIEISNFVIETLKSIFKLEIIDTESIENLLNEYNVE